MNFKLRKNLSLFAFFATMGIVSFAQQKRDVMNFTQSENVSALKLPFLLLPEYILIEISNVWSIG